MRAARCGTCRHFLAEPLALERALPGLSALSSAFASVRGDDGLCALNERYVGGSSHCERHQAPAAPAAGA